MTQIYKNKVLAEYSREELEEEFLKNCEILDSRAAQIIQLEQKAQYLSSRLSRLTQDMDDPNKSRNRFTGSQAPSAYHQSQMNVRDLQNQIGTFQRELGQRQVQRDNIARQVKYFKSLQNFSTFRAKSVKSSSRNQITTRLIREDIQRAVEQLFNKKTVPQMNNRLLATIAVLKGDYKAAEAPLHSLMKSIGESVSLYECLERRKQLRDRESKISQLSNKLEELKQRYNDLLQRQKEQIDQYQSEADQNKQRNQEVINLQREKETKEMEAAKTAELKIVADGLRSEIELLENQKAKLQGDNNERQMRVQTQVQDALSQLRLEIQELEDKSKSVREQNTSLEKQTHDLEQARVDAIKRRSEAEEHFKKLQVDYKSVLGTFNKMVENSEADPFDDQRFVVFLTQMATKQWDPEHVKNLSEEIEKLTATLQGLKDKIAKYESAEAQMNKRISSKRDEISALETQLRALANDLGQNSSEDAREKPQYTEGAHHIRFTDEDKSKIGDDQTAIIIMFRDFKLSPSFIGKKPSQIFLVVDFLEHKSMTTKFVDPNDESFDSSIFFVCKNDFILRAYLEKSAVPVQLCRSRDDQVTEAGQTELNLLPFLDNCLEFSSTVKIWNETGKAVGKVTFEAALYSPLQQQ
ncbi:hypothetical protein TRFO_01385 [Tritrichomonas foetus]|uniref:RPGR-interacting protein 1 first C2 domain-containing protein n=1 Tax=Tritrichomonas foetus TaxID=1144522 RepID=A0A1J4KCP2_9EUKA|nr:hypothetical protein TRFO_01385 [Tritrichomonas foetus]|eukprot:OHT07221.1 hypothetical protein TRFO_01385 [Tritrichomonas foetus]